MSRSAFGSVTVVTGGRSAERDRSLLSGRTVAAALTRIGCPHEVLDAADPDFPDKVRGVDIAFLAIAGQWAEDGKLQGLLESLGVAYTGSGVLASATAMHKPTAKALVSAAGVRVLPHVLHRPEDDPALTAKRAVHQLDVPVICKPVSEGGSVGMSVARTLDDLTSTLTDREDTVMVEAFTSGTAVTCGVLHTASENEGAPVALPPLETLVTRADFYDYAAKRDPGAHIYRCPAALHGDVLADVQRAAVSAHEALGCFGYSRSDFLVADHGEAWWLEVNTLPGLSEHGNFATMARAAGIGYDDLVVTLLGCVSSGLYRP
jgi:D-alanine-D-alanine ligase